jgi:hypothetical protein
MIIELEFRHEALVIGACILLYEQTFISWFLLRFSDHLGTAVLKKLQFMLLVKASISAG